MKFSACRSLVLVAIVISFSGCPFPSLPFMLGTWVFHLEPLDVDIAIVLESGGMTSDRELEPGETYGSFEGIVTWMESDPNFSMFQEADGGLEYQWTGTILSETAMEGSFMQTAGGNQSGTWSATFLR